MHDFDSLNERSKWKNIWDKIQLFKRSLKIIINDKNHEHSTIKYIIIIFKNYQSSICIYINAILYLIRLIFVHFYVKLHFFLRGQCSTRIFSEV
jgi:hypothetical protein